MLLLDPLTCMAAALYFESRGELPIHQVMVANTIQNRVKSSRYPNDICSVIKQKHQFSFYWDGILEVVDDSKSWSDIVVLASYTIRTKLEVTTACHYAHKDIQNHWTKVFNGKLHGNHIFYEGGC